MVASMPLEQKVSQLIMHIGAASFTEAFFDLISTGLLLKYLSCLTTLILFFYSFIVLCSLNYNVRKLRSLGYKSRETCILNTLLIHVII